MPQLLTDRPLPIPHNSNKLANKGQFVEILDDVVFTVEYLVQTAQIAVYKFLDIDRQILTILPHAKSLRVQFEVLIKAFK